MVWDAQVEHYQRGHRGQNARTLFKHLNHRCIFCIEAFTYFCKRSSSFLKRNWNLNHIIPQTSLHWHLECWFLSLQLLWQSLSGRHTYQSLILLSQNSFLNRRSKTSQQPYTSCAKPCVANMFWKSDFCCFLASMKDWRKPAGIVWKSGGQNISSFRWTPTSSNGFSVCASSTACNNINSSTTWKMTLQLFLNVCEILGDGKYQTISQ